MNQKLLRQIPQVEKALGWPEIEGLISSSSRGEVLRVLRSTLANLRTRALNGEVKDEHEAEYTPEGISSAVATRLGREKLSPYRRVINGTGILLHTGLGRAVLPESAVDTLQANLRGYSVVEVDPQTGERNQREDALSELLGELTGAPAATVVNNNAAAT
ncbi:MAG: L-seryl-tRNA(Sec) selenium transferase, partial [Planctomycetota bacterium]